MFWKSEYILHCKYVNKKKEKECIMFVDVKMTACILKFAGMIVIMGIIVNLWTDWILMLTTVL